MGGLDLITPRLLGHVEGVIGGGHQMQTDSKGNLYIALTNRGLQKLTFKGLSDSGK